MRCPDCDTELAYRACSRGAAPTDEAVEALEEVVLAAHRQFSGCPASPPAPEPEGARP